LQRGALVIVCGGRITFAGGFGRTAAGDTVDPNRTIFRAASNSKLFAATAVMQLVDRGLWTLDDDVNRYLPPAARLGPLGGAPVTLAHLLTHTAGLDATFAGSVVIPADRMTLDEYFARHSPRRVARAGEEISYSNVGMALAGYLVEMRTAQPFARYAERHIFAPLGMTRSSFDQPPPSAWARDLAGGPPHGRYDVVFNPYPAASLVTTPVDMGRFIAAHLATETSVATLGAGRVLSPEALATMHASHFRAQPDAPGVAFGFFEGELNGHRTLFHTGDSGDHSLVLLLPDEHVGLYFVFSGTDEQTSARDMFAREFMDAFFPGDRTATQSAVAPMAPARIPTAAFAGTYRTAAYSRSNYEKARALFAQVRVRAGTADTLLITPPGASVPVHLARGGPLTFRRDSGEVVAFRASAAGQVTGFTLSGLIWDPSSWDRIAWWQDGRLHLLALGLATLTLAVRLAWTPVAWIARATRRGQRRVVSPAERRIWRWSGFVAASFFVAPIIGAGTALLSFSHPLRAIPRAVAVLTTLLLVVVVGGVALAPAVMQAWRHHDSTRSRLIVASMTVVACAILGTILWCWNLLMPWSLG
jgi:CubicO group peptidase (beta-lactamase class C family)